MVAVPKKKTPRYKKSIKKSRYWSKTSLPSLVPCSQCKKPILPHHVCPYCGTYKGIQVIDVEARLKKKKAKEEKAKKEEKESPK